MARNLADYYQALADLHRTWADLIAWARDLGLSPPSPPAVDSAPSASKKKPSPSKRVRKRRPVAPNQSQRVSRPLTQMTLVTDEITVPIGSLSRPQLCLAVLRKWGDLTTRDTIGKLKEIGIDWSDVAGGFGNAVHGALWREKVRGNVIKTENGPWKLVDPSTAPRLDLDSMTATLSPKRVTSQVLAQARRDAMLSVLGHGRMTPHEILGAMRKLPEYAKMPRHAVREDLEALIAEGKAERAGYGLYRKGVSA